jgi:hypothetical protein
VREIDAIAEQAGGVLIDGASLNWWCFHSHDSAMALFIAG